MRSRGRAVRWYLRLCSVRGWEGTECSQRGNRSLLPACSVNTRGATEWSVTCIDALGYAGMHQHTEFERVHTLAGVPLTFGCVFAFHDPDGTGSVGRSSRRFGRSGLRSQGSSLLLLYSALLYFYLGRQSTPIAVCAGAHMDCAGMICAFAVFISFIRLLLCGNSTSFLIW